MKKKRVTFKISKDGMITMEVNGVAGPACVEATAKMMQQLGSVLEQEKTSDYYKRDYARTKVR